MEEAINTHLTALEVAEEATWFKSSYSTDNGGACVEVADLAGQVGIRDSKHKQGSVLFVPVSSWSEFVGLVRSEQVDFGVADR